MKFLAVFVALVAVAVGAPVTTSTWTLQELSEAIQNPSTNPAILPYLEEALNQMMANIMAGHQPEPIAVSIPEMDVSTWTLNELSEAIQDPSTNPALLPYLEHALNEYMDALWSGTELEAIPVVIPAGLLPVSPVVVPEVAPPAPVPAVVPETVAPPTAAGSPLVQIIVNINNQASEVAAPAPVLVPSPAVIPEAVAVVEDSPLPITVVDQAPEPITVVEQAPEPITVVEVAPEPVAVVEVAPETVAVVEVAPESPAVVELPAPVNPIDVIAVAAPEVNPVDIISPVIVQPAVVGGEVVGPIV